MVKDGVLNKNIYLETIDQQSRRGETIDKRE